VLHRHGHASAGTLAVRLLDDQWHAQRRVVERQSRASLSVIADHDKCGAVIEAALLEGRREPGHRRIRVASVDLDEQEEPLAAAHLNPAFGRVDRERTLALEHGNFVAIRRRNLRVEE
jgi:hypothetical protein